MCAVSSINSKDALVMKDLWIHFLTLSHFWLSDRPFNATESFSDSPNNQDYHSRPMNAEKHMHNKCVRSKSLTYLSTRWWQNESFSNTIELLLNLELVLLVVQITHHLSRSSDKTLCITILSVKIVAKLVDYRNLAKYHVHSNLKKI